MSKKLEDLWNQAMEARQEGDDSKARKCLRKLLKQEPRLAEPHLELGHMEIQRDDLDEAEVHVRMAVEILERGGQWIDDVKPSKLLSFAVNLLGEILFRRAERISAGDDRQRFDDLWNEAAGCFTRATGLDPENGEAKRNAFDVRRRGGEGARGES